MPRKTMVCRCEDVTADEIRESIVKACANRIAQAFSRVGTGPCQGKCARNLARLLLEAGVRPPKSSRSSAAAGRLEPSAAFAGHQEGSQ